MFWSFPTFRAKWIRSLLVVVLFSAVFYSIATIEDLKISEHELARIEQFVSEYPADTLLNAEYLIATATDEESCHPYKLTCDSYDKQTFVWRQNLQLTALIDELSPKERLSFFLEKSKLPQSESASIRLAIIAARMNFAVSILVDHYYTQALYKYTISDNEAAVMKCYHNERLQIAIEKCVYNKIEKNINSGTKEEKKLFQEIKNSNTNIELYDVEQYNKNFITQLKHNPYCKKA
jgi:hypothetical protein